MQCVIVLVCRKPGSAPSHRSGDGDIHDHSLAKRVVISSEGEPDWKNLCDDLSASASLVGILHG